MLVAAQLIGIPGTQAIGLASLALGLGWVVVCLNAMRVGLLTRFMGVLGVICGALIVLPILVAAADRADVLARRDGRCCWPAAGRAALPPAWSTGEAMPWPSQQQLREQRRTQMARAAAAGAGAASPSRSPSGAPHRRPHARLLAQEEA